MAEELGRVWGALAVTVDTHAGVIEMIAKYGTAQHRERYYRDAVMGGIGEGTTQILKLLVGRKLTGVQAFMDMSLYGVPPQRAE